MCERGVISTLAARVQKTEPPLWHMFCIDLRSLAAFRIAVGLILIWDLIMRSRDMTAHYTDEGVLPRTVLMDNYLSLRPYLSVHILHGSLTFQTLMFCIAGLCALAMTLGYRSRPATIACWFLTCSLHARNPLIVHGGDDLLRVMLFWAMFVPLGARWSIDAGRASGIDGDRDQVCPDDRPPPVREKGVFVFDSGPKRQA